MVADDERFHPIRPRSRPRRRPPRRLHHFVGHPAKAEGIGLGEVLDRTTMQLARTIDVAKKYVVSSSAFQSTRSSVRGDLEKAVLQLKRESGKGLFVAGVCHD